MVNLHSNRITQKHLTATHHILSGVTRTRPRGAIVADVRIAVGAFQPARFHHIVVRSLCIPT